MVKCIVIGSSAGSSSLIKSILKKVPKDFTIPIVFLRHIGTYMRSEEFAKNLSEEFFFNIKEVEDKDLINPSTIYIAPPGYHLQFENTSMFSLSLEDKQNYNRPSIDILFETAAHIFGEDVVGIILSGANSDGARGLKEIKLNKGITIVQDPETAEFPLMPMSAIKETDVDYICSIDKISELIISFNSRDQKDII